MPWNPVPCLLCKKTIDNPDDAVLPFYSLGKFVHSDCMVKETGSYTANMARHWYVSGWKASGTPDSALNPAEFLGEYQRKPEKFSNYETRDNVQRVQSFTANIGLFFGLLLGIPLTWVLLKFQTVNLDIFKWSCILILECAGLASIYLGAAYYVRLASLKKLQKRKK